MPTEAELVTPERVLFSGEAAFVVLRTDGGEIMFLPEHAPFIGAVDISLLRIARAGDESGEDEFRAAVHGGFVHVTGNKVTVLASVAEKSDEIDVDRARRAFEAARAGVGGGSGGGDAAAAAAAPAPAGHEEKEEPAELSASMKAMLFPDDPEVALRRAEVRLEAAGAEQPTAASA
ncbi:MAG: ATP synthase F1 subunit epsilon [Acidimicrobiales bacterium]